ncbi:MAG: lysophospholipid acyltransferase family protein [Polynucleobacter sp.]|nr:lysophospholipid acyltransferase family protein [Polynucleobacter sp.]
MISHLLNLVLRIVAALPLAVTQCFGGFLGYLAYLVSSKYRVLFRTNYAHALHTKQLKPQYLKAIPGSGMLLSDSLWIWHNPEKALALAEVTNWDLVAEAIDEGHGLIMLCPHLGGFEIIPRILANHFPATILYRPARQKWLNTVIESWRAYPNMHFVPTNLHGVRQMVRALSRGEAIGILPDQVPSGGEGVWVPFFGRYAYTTTLPPRLAGRKHIPVVLFSAQRKGLGQGWLIHAERLPAFAENTSVAATELNLALEKIILRAPNQYIWAYNRFKHPSGAELPPTQ